LDDDIGNSSSPYYVEMDYHDPYGYCRYATNVLDRAIVHAVRLGSRQRFAESRAVLIEGIQKSIKVYGKWSYSYKPLTKEALIRALDLDKSFNNKCGAENSTCQADRRSLRFLIGYLEHVKNTVIPFEMDYHIPYQMNGWYGNSGNNWDVFASHYKDVAVSLLEVYTGRGADRQMPETLGNDIFEIRVAAKLFGWASFDLYRDDYNRLFYCEISGLRGMAEELRDHLKGGSQFYSNGEARVAARNFATDVLSNINGYSCHRRYSDNRYDNRNGSQYNGGSGSQYDNGSDSRYHGRN